MNRKNGLMWQFAEKEGAKGHSLLRVGGINSII